MIGLPSESRGVPLYRLKVTLKGSKPPIWRRLIVRSDLKLPRLHDCLQIVMGWMNCHMHQFRVKNIYYLLPNPEFTMDFNSHDERKFTLAQIASKAKSK